MSNQIRTDILRVKGTRHYEAELAFKHGELATNAKILLEPQPQNSHDKNAVAVLSYERTMLGHISRDVAAKYQELCFDDGIYRVYIQTATRSDDHALFDIRIAVTYTTTSDSISTSLPTTPGAYEISLKLGVTYIGATENLNRRYKQHVNQLTNKSHPNKALQKDFNNVGYEDLTFKVLKRTKSRLDAENYESSQISKRLENGEQLYNKTIDGKGRKSSNYDSQNTVSDFFADRQIILDRAPSDSPHTELNDNNHDSTSDYFYTSDFVAGKTNGIGEYIWSNNDVYVGSWRNGKFSGKGKFTWNYTYNEYEGNWRNGKASGKGKYTWATGDIYEGDWVSDKRTGKGKLSYANGDIYEGNWVKGEYQG